MPTQVCVKPATSRSFRQPGKHQLHTVLSQSPTTNYCWVVSQVALPFVIPKGTTCWRVDVDGHGRFHWFLKDPNGTIVGLTLDQAEGWWEMPEYEKAKRYYFRPAMSRRDKKLAELLGIVGEAGKA